MNQEPHELRHLLQGARLLEQMRGARHDGQPVLAAQPGTGPSVEVQDQRVPAAHHQERRGPDLGQVIGREVGLTAA